LQILMDIVFFTLPETMVPLNIGFSK